MATVTKGLFIDQDYVYAESAIDENTDWKLIRPVVWACQKLYIEELIGSPLYNAIETAIIADTLSGVNQTLTNEYLAPCLLYYTMMEGQVEMTFKFRNRSVLSERTNDADSVDFQSHKYLKSEYRNRAEVFAEKITRYLCANSASFPLYTTYTTSDEVRAKEGKATTSLFLGTNRNECRSKS